MIDSIGDEIEKVDDLSRIKVFIKESILKNCGLNILYFLSKESQDIQSIYYEFDIPIINKVNAMSMTG